MRGTEFSTPGLGEADYNRAALSPFQSPSNEFLGNAGQLYQELEGADMEGQQNEMCVRDYDIFVVPKRKDISIPFSVRVPEEYEQLHPADSSARLEAENTLRTRMEVIMERAGITSSVITGVDTIYDERRPADLIPSRYEMILQRGEHTMKASMRVELGFEDGKGDLWDARIFLTPIELQSKGQNVSIPTEVTAMGYQMLVKSPTGFQHTRPFVRLDSMCMTGMIDGHKSSAGREGLGCDCCAQREIGKAFVQEIGGVAILDPFEGRGNGIEVHAGQIQIQNFEQIFGISQPDEQIDTYKAHEKQGAAKDSRKPHYIWAGMIISELFDLHNISAGTNNNQKMNAIQECVEHVERIQIVDKSATGYYGDINANAKRSNGHNF